MVATPRRLLLALVALAASTPVLAEIVCNPNPDGSWTCSGYGGGGSYPPGTVVTNVVGVCTNCVAMSPSACEDLKSGIISSVGRAEFDAQSILQNISDTLQYGLEPLKAEGDSFIGPELYGPAGISASEGKASSQFRYASYSSPSVDMEGRNVSYIGTANNSIANYYQQAVKPVLEASITALSTSKSEVSSVLDSLSGIEGLVDSVDCSACTASYGGPSTTTNSPPSSGSCPCNEQMEAIKSLLQNDFLPRIKKIDTNVAQLTNLITIAREQLRVTKEGFYNVTNLFNRLDDYVLDDFSNKVFQIQIDVNYIASNLAAKVRNLFIDNQYSNSTFYTSIDGQKDIDIQHLDTQLITESDGNKSFDWGEYKDLTWFERIEFMLLHMGGFYSLTNAISGGTTNYSSFADSLESKADDLESAANAAQSGFNSVKTSFTGFVSSFKSAFGNHDAIKEIHLISNYLGTQQPLVLKIDPDIIDICRVITSLLWTALFAVVLFKVFVRFWVECVEWSRILIFDVTISFGK